MMAEWVRIPERDGRLAFDDSCFRLDTPVTLDCPCGRRVRIPDYDGGWYHPVACACGRVYRVRYETIIEEHV